MDLVHFGFMNESAEMYAGKGVEKTFSFLHLSLQEYLAAWHLAHSYSIEFQVAYHSLSACNDPQGIKNTIVEPGSYLTYKLVKKEEKDLMSQLSSQKNSLVEPALFLAGITGLKCLTSYRDNL